MHNVLIWDESLPSTTVFFGSPPSQCEHHTSMPHSLSHTHEGGITQVTIIAALRAGAADGDTQ